MTHAAHKPRLVVICLVLLILAAVVGGPAASARVTPTPDGPLAVIGEIYWKPNGTPVSTAGGVLEAAVMVADGAGGAILAWSDCRIVDDCDIYAQRLDSNGEVHWAGNGIPLVTAPGGQVAPHLVSDGAGGAIAAWTDYRSETGAAVFAQRVTADGSLLWGTTAVTITAGADDRILGALVPDDAGGAFIVWEQAGTGDTIDTNLFAHRLTASGTLAWTVPVTVTAAPGEQYDVQAAADGFGGVIVTWGDLREPLDPNVYAQRFDASGTTLWDAHGIPVSVDPARQSPPARLVADGTGGALVAWHDYRTNTRRSDIYMQRLSAGGARAWGDDLAVMASQGLSEATTALFADGAGGAILLANALPEVVSDTDIYAQRISPAGSRQWGELPVNVTPWPDRQLDAVGVADGFGGAYVAWTDQYSDSPYVDVWTQHLDANGSALWADHGAQAVAITRDQKYLAAVSDGQFGLIVGWQDGRRDPDNPDLYAQGVGDRIYRFGLPFVIDGYAQAR